MTLTDRLRTAMVRAHAATRVAPHLLELRAGGHTNAAVLLSRHVALRPDGAALLFETERYTWREVDRRANQWARFFLLRGVRVGEVVALVMDNRPEYVFVLLALSKIRAICACVNTNVTGAALAHVLRAASPRLVVVGSEHAAAFDAIARDVARDGHMPDACIVADRGASHPLSVDAEIAGLAGTGVTTSRPLTSEPMTYLYTSGTTGMPKAAVVTNQRFLAASYALGKVMHEATPEDVIYTALPLYHGTGQWGGLGAALATGATLAVRRRFSASSFWADAVRFRATRMTYIGELCRYLLHQPVSPDEARHGIQVAVGNGLRPDVWPEFQRRFRVPTIREFYGATEGNAPLANLTGRPGMLGTLGLGQALLACDLETGKVLRDRKGRCRRVEKPGETGLFVGRISRVATFDGYVDGRATDAKILRDVFAEGDAWFDTGDLLTLHDDGWVSFADRVGDTFRWKGENVSTMEVASLLGRAPGVIEANVYGVVVPGADGRAGMASLRVSDSFDLLGLARHVEGALPKYARPLFLRLQTDMRVTGTLKHQKNDYRAEGYDPAKVTDPLYVLIGSEYLPVTAERFDQIRSRALALG